MIKPLLSTAIAVAFLSKTFFPGCVSAHACQLCHDTPLLNNETYGPFVGEEWGSYGAAVPGWLRRTRNQSYYCYDWTQLLSEWRVMDEVGLWGTANGACVETPIVWPWPFRGWYCLDGAGNISPAAKFGHNNLGAKCVVLTDGGECGDGEGPVAPTHAPICPVTGQGYVTRPLDLFKCAMHPLYNKTTYAMGRTGQEWKQNPLLKATVNQYDSVRDQRSLLHYTMAFSQWAGKWWGTEEGKCFSEPKRGKLGMFRCKKWDGIYIKAARIGHDVFGRRCTAYQRQSSNCYVGKRQSANRFGYGSSWGFSHMPLCPATNMSTSATVVDLVPKLVNPVLIPENASYVKLDGGGEIRCWINCYDDEIPQRWDVTCRKQYADGWFGYEVGTETRTTLVDQSVDFCVRYDSIAVEGHLPKLECGAQLNIRKSARKDCADDPWTSPNGAEWKRFNDRCGAYSRDRVEIVLVTDFSGVGELYYRRDMLSAAQRLWAFLQPLPNANATMIHVTETGLNVRRSPTFLRLGVPTRLYHTDYGHYNYLGNKTNLSSIAETVDRVLSTKPTTKKLVLHLGSGLIGNRTLRANFTRGRTVIAALYNNPLGQPKNQASELAYDQYATKTLTATNNALVTERALAEVCAWLAALNPSPTTTTTPTTQPEPTEAPGDEMSIVKIVCITMTVFLTVYALILGSFCISRFQKNRRAVAAAARELWIHNPLLSN
ncbi:membrane protein ORF80 [Anguillid herpesvirus 1]|uniref:Membrane protein ORF80 n=1 Tax=Anguillid herpesvirus 1 TaxID=150286 RepID=A0A8E5EUA9_9VIRU|nr:membrane protein ORF80 [Anguillid herpesvirus 1]ADA57843.1 membrane protein ORF80 [Anguillid herpesvirus 1]QRM16373.1 membrane protein ORF80 [Anguillid herpesvirus 1]QRM16632.1 membrane protein ORF80 [Anguillid herpesvirus 1]